MYLIKRFVLLPLCLFGMNLVIFTLVTVIAGIVALGHAPDSSTEVQFGTEAGLAFATRYYTFIRLSAVGLTGVVFRLPKLIIALILAVGLYFCPPPDSASAPGDASPSTGPAAAPPTEITAGQRRTLLSAVTVDNPYGKAQVAPGTMVEVLSVKGDSVHIRVPGGQSVLVPRGSLK